MNLLKLIEGKFLPLKYLGKFGANAVSDLLHDRH